MSLEEMTCESGLDDTHGMPVEGSVYVFTVEGDEALEDNVGELVACRRCAEQLAKWPGISRVVWEGETLWIFYPASPAARPEARARG